MRAERPRMGADAGAFDLLMPALTVLSSSSFAVVGLDPEGAVLSPEEVSDRVRTGRRTDETFLAVTARPGFAEMGPV